MMRTLIVFLFAITGFVQCTPTKKVAIANAENLSATALQPYGRTRLTADGALELISSAVHFSVRFNDTALEVYTSLPSGLDHNYLQYELDGAYQKRLRVTH